MPSLIDQFGMLVDAAKQGRFADALAASALAEQPARCHPLNFVAIRVEDDAGIGLRLHLWDNCFAFGQRGFEVHDHVFDLDSLVVGGTVRQTLYQMEPAEDGELSVYDVQYEGNGALLKRVRDHLKLHPTKVEDFGKGSRYSLKHGLLHRLEPLTPTAMTLVLTRTHGGRPVSIGPTEGALFPRIRRPAITDSLGRVMTIAADGLDAISTAARTDRVDTCDKPDRL